MRTIVLILSFLIAGAASAESLIARTSTSDVATTVARLKAEIEKRNLTIVATVDHGAAAKNAGLELRPTVLLMFGNPRGGTPLMRCNQALGIELPMKMLVWQDAGGKVQVGYTPPKETLARQAASACEPDIAKSMESLLAGLAEVAAGK